MGRRVGDAPFRFPSFFKYTNRRGYAVFNDLGDGKSSWKQRQACKNVQRYETNTKRHRVRGVKRGAWRGASFPLSPRALAGGSSDCAKFVSKLWATGFVTRGGYLRSDTAPPRPRCASFLAFFSARFLESGSSQPTSEQPGWPFHHPSCLEPFWSVYLMRRSRPRIQRRPMVVEPSSCMCCSNALDRVS
jgi:hypothetical protein